MSQDNIGTFLSIKMSLYIISNNISAMFIYTSVSCSFIEKKIFFTVGVDILLEFLEVAFNHILYFRKIYPKEIYVKRKIYGITVYVSEHPELNEYLSNILNAIRELIKENENSIKIISLTFYNENKSPIEKFVFDIVKLQAEFVEYVATMNIYFS